MTIAPGEISPARSGIDLLPSSNNRWIALSVILVLAVAALWPAILNGGPFYMPDTPSYVRGAASAFFKALGLKTEWLTEYLRVYETMPPPLAEQSARAAAAPHVGAPEIPVTISGRSIFYGVFLYVAHLAGTFWIAAAVQGLLAGIVVWLTVGSIASVAGRAARPLGVLLIGLSVIAVTPMAFFAGYLMPDIFGAFALLATANVLFLWKNMSPAERVFWLALLAYSLLVHSVNLMMVGGLTVASIAFAWWRRSPVSKVQLGGVAGCLAVAVLGQAAFGVAVTSMTGAAPVRPPFIAMRLIADGPGYAYLKEHCSSERFIYCRVLSQPEPKSDTLLWSKDPQTSLFRGLSPNEQRLSAAQQSDFIRAVVADRPVDVVVGAAGNSLNQLFRLDLNGFNYSPENRARFHETVPEELFGPLSQTRAYLNIMPTPPTEILSALTAVLSVLFLCFFAASARSNEGVDRLRAFCLCVLAGIVLNAVICGALSGPKGRYEMRLIWVLPLIAGAIASTGTVHWRRSRELSDASPKLASEESAA